MLPENLIIKPVSFEQTLQPGVLKPTYGSLGSQYVRFHVHKEYNGADSTVAGKEVYRPIEVCEFQNDRFTRCPIRVKDLSAKQKVELAPIYERFRTQKESDETAVTEWDAVTDLEKGFLMTAGVYTVEQLGKFEDTELHRLGPGGTDLRLRARRHMRTKEDAKPKAADELKNEIALLRAEKEDQNARMKALEEKFFKQEAEKAAAKKEAASAAVLTPVAEPKKQKRQRRTKEQMAAFRAAVQAAQIKPEADAISEAVAEVEVGKLTEGL